MACDSTRARGGPIDAIVNVLDGKAEVVIDGELKVVESGQVVLMPADIPHAINAAGRFKMLLIMIRKVAVQGTYHNRSGSAGGIPVAPDKQPELSLLMIPPAMASPICHILTVFLLLSATITWHL